MSRVTFLQPYDPMGYRIVVEPPTKPRKVAERKRPLGGRLPVPTKTILEEGGSTEPPGPTVWIKRKGGKLNYRKVRFEKELIYKRLAATETTPDGALAFVEKFGFLRSVGHREKVTDICKHILTMQWLLNALRDDDRYAINIWLIGTEWYRDEKGKLLSRSARPPVRRGLRYGSDEDDRPQLEDAPLTLIEALYLQCLRDASGSKDYKLCRRPGCGTWFYFGPNTGKRSTAKYCSDRCRVTDFLQRKEQSR